MVVHIITRDQWGANQSMSSDNALLHPVTHVFTMSLNREMCYSEGACSEELQRTQDYFVRRQKQSDIRHNFIVGGNGLIFEGRGWFAEPSLPRKYASLNRKSILIGLFGAGNSAAWMPAVMMKATSLLVQHGVRDNYISELFLYYDLMFFQSIHRYNHRLSLEQKLEQRA